MVAPAALLALPSWAMSGGRGSRHVVTVFFAWLDTFRSITVITYLPSYLILGLTLHLIGLLFARDRRLGFRDGRPERFRF